MSEETATEDATTSGDSGCGSDSVFTLASATDLLTIGSGERSKQKCPASPSKRWTMWTMPQKHLFCLVFGYLILYCEIILQS